LRKTEEINKTRCYNNKIKKPRKRVSLRRERVVVVFHIPNPDTADANAGERRERQREVMEKKGKRNKKSKKRGKDTT
jgi:hypothetical protein